MGELTIAIALFIGFHMIEPELRGIKEELKKLNE